TAFKSDYTWTDGGSFHRQHEVFPMHGGFSVFDSKAKGVNSRALEIVVDEQAKTVREGRSWDMGEHCKHEGGSVPPANGGMFATCATSGKITEFPADSSKPVWTMTVKTDGIALPRGVPMSLP